jgi:hypothetical protein
MNAVLSLEGRVEHKAPIPNDRIDSAMAELSNDPGALFERDVLDSLQQLRRNDPARFARIRSEAKASKAVAMAEFDRLTTSSADVKAGGEMFTDVEPWPDPVDGAELLDGMVDALGCYVIADITTLQAAAIWAVHTWLIDLLTVSPIANITAPEMRCGKTVMLTAIGKLSYRPMQVSSILPAALFRSIEAWQPTLLIDEVDTFLGENEEARGVINSGFTRDSAFVVRCVGDDHTPTKFSTWGAKALCGIGKIANTLADRSIPLRLRRKTAGESADNLRHADEAVWMELRAKIARFASDHGARIALARPVPISGLGDRANDCWEPLVAIAEAAGGEWPKRARHAATVLQGLEADAPTIGQQLLSDINLAFGTRGRMSTSDLLTALAVDEESPWATWNRGKPFNARQLSTRLSEFGIRPNTTLLAGAISGCLCSVLARSAPYEIGNTVTTQQWQGFQRLLMRNTPAGYYRRTWYRTSQ